MLYINLNTYIYIYISCIYTYIQTICHNAITLCSVGSCKPLNCIFFSNEIKGFIG